MAAPSERRRVLARAGRLEYDRVVFFSDAVFAIAITLLIVDLQVPEVAHVESGRQLRDALPRIGGFALSFAVIGLFWMGHHRLFRHIKGLNWSLVLLNLLFLGCIAFLPHPTALLSAAGDQVPATIFYAAAGLAEAAVWLYEIRIPRAGPPRHLARGAPLDAAADHPDPGGVPRVDPGRDHPDRPGQVPVAARLGQRVGVRSAGTGRRGAGGHRRARRLSSAPLLRPGSGGGDLGDYSIKQSHCSKGWAGSWRPSRVSDRAWRTSRHGMQISTVNRPWISLKGPVKVPQKEQCGPTPHPRC